MDPVTLRNCTCAFCTGTEPDLEPHEVVLALLSLADGCAPGTQAHRALVIVMNAYSLDTLRSSEHLYGRMACQLTTLRDSLWEYIKLHAKRDGTLHTVASVDKALTELGNHVWSVTQHKELEKALTTPRQQHAADCPDCAEHIQKLN